MRLLHLSLGFILFWSTTALAQTALVQAATEVDYRYDTASNRYYFDANQNGSHDSGEQYADINVLDASDFSSIQAAINACGAGSTTKQGCIVRIPFGVYAENISIGGTTTPTTQYGITLEGVGNGLENNIGGDICAVTITGNGTLNNTIVTIDGVFQVTLRNFCIDGDENANPAKYGVHIAPNGAQPTHYVTLEDMTIEDVTASGGYAIAIGNGGTAQADFITMQRLILRSNNGCIMQDSQQAVENTSRLVECAQFTGPQAYLIAQGQLRISEFYIAPSSASQAGIVYLFGAAGGPIGAEIDSGTFEWNADNGTFIDFRSSPGTGSRRTNFIKNVRFQPQVAATSRHVCIDWNVRGTLVLVANDFESSNTAWNCQLDLNNSDTTIPSYVHMYGNQVNFNFSENLVIVRSTNGGLLSLRRTEMGLDQTCTNLSPCTSTLSSIRKSTEPANDTASFVDDADLQFPVVANETYGFRMVVLYDTTATADFKVQLTGPLSPAKVRYVISPVITGVSNANTVHTAFSTSKSIAGTGTNGYIEIEGILQNGANAGTVKLQWAQNTGVLGAGTRVVAGSYVEFAKK